MVVEELLQQLTDKAGRDLDAALDEEAQSELAHLIGLLPELRAAPDAEHTMVALEVAISALFLTPPNIRLAARIRKRLEQRVRDYNSLGRRLFAESAVAKVVLGLGMLLTLVVLGCIMVYQLYASCATIVCPDPKALRGHEDWTIYLPIAVVLMGALGGVVSIMSRVDKFNAVSSTDPWTLFFTGFFKPIIGMGLAFFLFTLLNSGLITVTSIQEGAPYAYFSLALAFLAGFSERFAQDIANRTGMLVHGADHR